MFWGWGWVVNKNSKHPAEAWEFVDVLTQDTEMHCQVSDFWIPIENMDEFECVNQNPAADGFKASVEQNPVFELKSNYAPEISRILTRGG